MKLYIVKQRGDAVYSFSAKNVTEARKEMTWRYGRDWAKRGLTLKAAPPGPVLKFPLSQHYRVGNPATCKLGKRAVACPTRGKKASGRKTTRMAKTTFSRGKTKRDAIRIGAGYVMFRGDDPLYLRPSSDALAKRLGLNHVAGTLAGQKRNRALRARVLRIVRKTWGGDVRWLDANGRRAALD